MIRILLAEDDTSMREYLQRALQRVGYEVESVGCGTEAMPLLEAEQIRPAADRHRHAGDGRDRAGAEGQRDRSRDPRDVHHRLRRGRAPGRPDRAEAKLLSKPFHLKDLVAEVDRLFQTEDQHGRL